MDEFTSGVIYWQNISYSLMPKFKPIITISSYVGGKAEIGVSDVSVNQITLLLSFMSFPHYPPLIISICNNHGAWGVF
jgi:hypothetical protein